MDLEERSGVDPVIERTCAECGPNVCESASTLDRYR